MRINIITLLFILLSAAFSSGYAQEDKKDFELNLQCDIAFSNYEGVESSSISKSVTLSNFKHKNGGTALVSQSDHYEFWAMVHGVQSINDKRFVYNFQVAIKDKKTGVFMHALSDSSYKPDQAPNHARISLVEYHPDSFLEKGELFFECTKQE